MKHFRKCLRTIITLGLASGLLACSSAPTIGLAPSFPAPKMKLISNNQLIWENISSFGPIPYQLYETAIASCQSLNTAKDRYKPVGYHASALDLEGRGIKGGGYYCLPE